MQQHLNVLINENDKCKITLNLSCKIDVKNENKWPRLDEVDHKDLFRMFQNQKGQLKSDEHDMIIKAFTWYVSSGDATE